MSPCTERTAPGSRLLWLTCIGVLVATPLLAQVPSLPPPGQAAQVLQQAVGANPSLANLITAKLQSSGMTPDQIRARLSAAGYSPNLLDSYMPGQPANQALNPGSQELGAIQALDRKSTRLNSSHPSISYAVFCLKKKKDMHRWDLVNYVRSLAGKLPGVTADSAPPGLPGSN